MKKENILTTEELLLLQGGDTGKKLGFPDHPTSSKKGDWDLIGGVFPPHD